MAYWGCLKIFVSENDSFRHQVNQIPMFDVWAFKDALFSQFCNSGSTGGRFSTDDSEAWANTFKFHFHSKN